MASNNNEKQKTETKARMSKLNRNMKLKGFYTSDIYEERRERDLNFKPSRAFHWAFRIEIRVSMFHSLIRRRILCVNFRG